MVKPAWLLFALALVSLAPAPAQRVPTALKIHYANEALPARQKSILARYADQILDWAASDRLVRAAQAQSAQTVVMERILEIDRRWQRGEDPDGLATALGRNDCAQALLSILAANPGFGEAFVTDSRGALVCMTRRTSDYWQGDEAKWSRAWAAGKGGVFVSEIEHDESTGLDLMHISVPLRAGSRVVGVLTVGKLRTAG
jgi:hypothetical protein